MNYIDIIQSPRTVSRNARQVFLILASSLLITLSAQISIHVPFSPVPVTGQTLAVLLLGALLGKNRAVAAVCLYLTQGAVGLPVFAGGNSGLVTILGPSGGYLGGFLAAVYVVGILTELRYNKSVLYTFLSLIIGNLVIYIFGLIWLVRFVGETQALQLGLYPFLLGDFLKIILGVMLATGIQELIKKTETNQ
jgi:biotin transport system substrate-specific component